MIERLKCSTPDFAKENAKKLLALFPECEGLKGEVSWRETFSAYSASQRLCVKN